MSTVPEITFETAQEAGEEFVDTGFEAVFCDEALLTNDANEIDHEH